MIYKFIDDQGTFTVKDPRAASYLYFPLTDKDGSLLSSVSPNLAGDIKRDNLSFLTPPASIEDIQHNLLCRRDFFLFLHGKKNRVLRCSEKMSDTLEAGLLYHKLTKKNDFLRIEIVNFIPFDLPAEVMWIKIKNTGKAPLCFSPTSFIPLYGRGEPQLHDHRHVSSLLNRVELTPYGITLRPTMIFNEKGHSRNSTCYYVRGYEGNCRPPRGQFPTLLSFCGEGGDLLAPEAVYKDLSPFSGKDPSFDGKENCAAFRFSRRDLAPGAETDYVLIMGISDRQKDIEKSFGKLDSVKKIKAALSATKRYWQSSLSLDIDFKDKGYNNWLKWVQLQPTLRKLFGCSFLPHFDYGKGGRGFRDLWQDCLSLLVKDEPGVRELILHNFKSLRIDGSNATIIGTDGTFLSDRNSISRVWTDHGVWPLLTTDLYIQRSSDLSLLLKPVAYFKDHLLKRAREIDRTFKAEDLLLRDRKGNIYKGTVLEHLLIENLVQFFNVGGRNNLRLENGDWNDGLDMAPDKGESVPFFSMYAANLNRLADLLCALEKKQKKIKILKEAALLFDTLASPLDYDNVSRKQALLEKYLESTKNSVSGTVISLSTDRLIRDLRKKAQWILARVSTGEWLKHGFFNGYYDNQGKRVEGKDKKGTRILLQSQVFPIMSGAASENQIRTAWKSISRYLKHKDLKGFCLNSDFKDLCLDLGRAFGFVYGDKENGAFFNHMIVMLSYALFSRGFINEGTEVFSSLYTMSSSSRAMIYPQLPEYFNSQGRGLYFYLTGSASWYLYTLLEQVLGVRSFLGDMLVSPCLNKKAFKAEAITFSFPFSGKRFRLTYNRSAKTKKYVPAKAWLDGESLPVSEGKMVLKKETIKKLSGRKEHHIQVELI